MSATIEIDTGQKEAAGVDSAAQASEREITGGSSITTPESENEREQNEAKDRFLLWYVHKWSYRNKPEYQTELERWRSDYGLTDEWIVEGESRLKGYLASVSDLIDAHYLKFWDERDTAEAIKALDQIRLDHTLSYEDFETLRK